MTIHPHRGRRMVLVMLSLGDADLFAALEPRRLPILHVCPMRFLWVTAYLWLLHAGIVQKPGTPNVNI